MAPDYDKKVPDHNKKVPESEKKVPESDKKYLKKTVGHIGRNIVQITIKMRTIVQIMQIIIIIKPHLKHSEKYFVRLSNPKVILVEEL